MDHELIIRLARETGVVDEFHGVFPSMERFAALVAAHEREECAQILDDALGTAMLAKAQKNADGSDVYDKTIINTVCMALEQYSNAIRSRT